MTRKEAIEIFKNMLDAWDNYYTIAQSDKKREAVWLAISSLETDEAYQLEYERTTKNDLAVSSELEKNSKKLEKNFGELDCVSRQSVLDKIQRLINAEQNNIDENGDYMNYARERVNAYEAIQFFVENDCLCPSVTPQEPKTGHWITKPHVYGVTYCSECDFELKIDNTNYCPNCGTKMAESVEE